MRRRSFIISSIAAAGAILVVVLDPTIYTDRAVACEYTCSHMGYREWILGIKTGEWYEISPIERRLGGKDLKHRWVSYAGDGYGLLHRSRGHGRPHNAAHDTTNYWPYYESLTDEQLRELYESFQQVESGPQHEALDELMQERLFEFKDAKK